MAGYRCRVSELGEFLRTSRDRIDPAGAGIEDGRRRRVPGLRREEVAARTGVSVDYYVRLEQGRERSPSTQTAAALARALLMDGHDTLHLFRLAGITPAISIPADQRLDPDLRELIDSLTANPIIVLGHALDVVAANPLGEALFCGWQFSRNLLESVFLDPQATTFYRDWDEIADYTATAFRLLHGEHPTDGRINTVLGRIAADSPRFRQIWATNVVRGRRLRRKRLRHPIAGDLTVTVQALDPRSNPGLELVVYRPATAADANKLHELGQSLGSSSRAMSSARPPVD